MKWPLTFYVKHLDAIGKSFGPIIRIQEAYRNDPAVYYHELMHIKQWVILSLSAPWLYFLLSHLGYAEQAPLGVFGVLLHQVLYTVVPAYRQWAEVTAYRESIAYGCPPEDCARSLSKDYGLPLTYEQALHLLTD